ncbi:helix-hairpin-helix domain-containing protein [Methylobacter sp.]|uniref:helix-hairpin-helix domain-containing protein n=1 Tax=Methylobacter sp. TaxID=2051955 RepID=UPI00121452BD|nr:helix-hairpin-helix domain-containing protein [Methylobacter sp.]TAK65249.1 MAG: DNA-binding protein [Methylobacter sp.]
MVENKEIATKLRQIATLLEQQNANPFRVSAYLNAAQTIQTLNEPVVTLLEREGFAALLDLPGIGEGIARSISEFAATGRMSRLESLQTGHDPIALFEQIPGIGPKSAHRIIEALHIDTLEALELAAHNGRLNSVPGFSAKKVALVQSWLAHVLGYRRPRSEPHRPSVEPPIDLLLAVDQQYRKKAAAGELPTIAPKRFNPTGEAWLPIFHTTKQGWHFTALFSNTARAHQLDRKHDWVVIYFYDNQHHEGQHTIVTETRGPETGRRIVRGREKECRAYYENLGMDADAKSSSRS